MAIVRFAFKLVLVPFVLGLFLFHSWLIGALEEKTKIRKHRLQIASGYSRALLKILGVSVDLRVKGAPKNSPQKGAFVVSNHLSYLDAIIFASLYPTVFVTSVEVKNTPFLGLMARLSECLFVERRSRAGLPAEVLEIEKALEEGFNVIVFPEGTTSDGGSVLPFKRALFKAPLTQEADVYPACIQYLKVNGSPFGSANRDRICYYGDHQFGAHFLGLLKVQSIFARVTVLDPVARVQDRNEVVQASFDRIHQTYHSPFEYQSFLA